MEGRVDLECRLDFAWRVDIESRDSEVGREIKVLNAYSMSMPIVEYASTMSTPICVDYVYGHGVYRYGYAFAG